MLDYLISNKENDLYYFLINEVKIEVTLEDTITIISKENNKKNNARLEALMKNLWGRKIKIIHKAVEDEKLGMKLEMIDDFKKSPEWKLLNKDFPKMKLDIIHRNWVISN